MNRKQWIRDTLMAFAVTLVPKILQPSVPEVSVADKLFKNLPPLNREMLDGVVGNLSGIEFVWYEFSSSGFLPMGESYSK
jgi:hypothetical protein